ncbi:MAG: argininosuccinate lyase [Firmicutes bacterium HGW-Firmicutes-9]|jgi:argininosuccinate lyase|nr:MAG: argininosuccinate lyase [Firmicutes bacterium HGW-Firmicutes-9]
MEKLWAGRTDGANEALADAFNRSIAFDARMFEEDIKGSMAHAAMLGSVGILPQQSVDNILQGLEGILNDIKCGLVKIDPLAEDIHSFVEFELTRRIGDDGKKLHTARSRNDQVALDLRLTLKKEIVELVSLTKSLIAAIANVAEQHTETVMPGYTHLQRAQPVTFGHWILAYAFMLSRDVKRLNNAQDNMNLSPLGACAFAGTTYSIDRGMTAKTLGFAGTAPNSVDAVADRDFCVELASAISMLMTHLSRFSEEIILWTSWEFRFVELADAFSTGSSIMPQKKNSDMAELVRGKTGRVFGDLITLLTMMKGLPLAYNKDLQEDKEAIFDAIDTAKMCLSVFAPMITTMTVKPENMRKAAAEGFINATDAADYLVKKGMPFRTAYKITGQLVAHCIANRQTLERLPLADYQAMSELFTDDIYEAVSLDTCVKTRISEGGTSPESVTAQIQEIRKTVLA